MDIWQTDKILLFLLFFIPGFISIKIYDLLIATERRDFSKSLFEVVGYSALNYAAFSWVIYLIHIGKFYDTHRLWYLLSLFIILFIAPILWPFIFIKLSNYKPFANYILLPNLKAWDYIFGRRESFWVIVHLKNDKMVGGKYDTNSYASSYPAEEQIYLEEVWKLDKNGKFLGPIERSKGMLILKDEIVSIEFFD